MKNEKFIEVRNKTNETIKSELKEKIMSGMLKRVDYIYDKDSNLSCITCTVKMYDKTSLEDVKDIVNMIIHKSIMDNCPEDELDCWYGSLLPDVLIESVSIVNDICNMVSSGMEG